MLMKKYKKQLITAFLIVFLFFFISFVAGYYFFNSKTSLEIRYKDSEIVGIKDILPISDQLGMSYSGVNGTPGVEGYSEFSIVNTSNKNISYEIYLTDDNISDNNDSIIKNNYVKLYLTNKNDVPFSGYDSRKIPSYYDLPVLNDIPGGKLLYRGKLQIKEIENFKLRVWLSNSYAISSNKAKKDFSFKVNIRGV